MAGVIKIRRQTPQKGCLLIHGFGGNTDEVQPLADYLESRGYRVENPLLEGHTGNRSDLENCTYLDWIYSAKRGYDKLSKECSEIYVIGFSMGGLIAFQLALKNNVKALVTLNTPIYYWNIGRIAFNILDDIRTRTFSNMKRYIESANQITLKASLNFRKLLTQTKPILADVRCPLFSVQALQDDAVLSSSADFIYRNSGSEFKKLKFYNGSGHLILRSKIADTVIRDVAAFLGEL